MISTESVLESGDQPWIPLEPLNNTHLPGKATPTAVFMDSSSSSPKVTANGVHDIEDRILRITGYYGYNPGYSSHRIRQTDRQTVRQSDRQSERQYSENAALETNAESGLESREEELTEI
ncbi:hypothetical protein PAMA_003765 [Pampus argenteus]